MKLVRTLYHFLGGVHFALILIASVALFVILGTFIESWTQSHRYAAFFTYDHPLFAALLWGFFINILFSALRRWPFRKRHIPFLITHLGLLMILAGVLTKHYFGIQGTMGLHEGTAADEILLANTYAIQIEAKDDPLIRHPLPKDPHRNLGTFMQTEGPLSIRLVEYCPHCKEYLTSWVKGSYAYIGAYPPMPLFAFEEEKIPAAGQAKLHDSNTPWDLYALKTAHPEKALAKLYSQHAQIIISNRINNEITHEIPLETLKEKELNLNFISKKGFYNPLLRIHWDNQGWVSIPLMGDQALFNLSDGLQLGYHPLAIDIIQKPFLAVIQDEQEDVYLAASDQHGRVWSQPFLKGELEQLLSYDDGFAGYTTQAILPFKSYRDSRQEREEALAYQFTLQLRQALANKIPLVPPLQLMKNTCDKMGVDFPEMTTLFFSRWNDTNRWLYPESIPLPDPLQKILAVLDWSEVPPSIQQGCCWTVQVFDQMQEELDQNPCLMTALRKNGWPLLQALEKELALEKNKDQVMPYTLLTQQLFAAAALTPMIDPVDQNENKLPKKQAALLSAYLRAYEIHFSNVLPIPKENELDEMVHRFVSSKQSLDKHLSSQITLETLVIPKQQILPPTHKLEDNQPKATFVLKNGERKQAISLVYDSTGKGLKWPVLHGDYLVRFQPQHKTIPYRVRLRQARQINYANSTQPYSFEGDLIFKDKRNAIIEEKTISMNHVHETWDGYRFYLSSIAPNDETAVKFVQIVVNHDPAKYWLTYPGALVLSLGILLLFIQRPYKSLKS